MLTWIRGSTHWKNISKKNVPSKKLWTRDFCTFFVENLQCLRVKQRQILARGYQPAKEEFQFEIFFRKFKNSVVLEQKLHESEDQPLVQWSGGGFDRPGSTSGSAPGSARGSASSFTPGSAPGSALIRP